MYSILKIYKMKLNYTPFDNFKPSTTTLVTEPRKADGFKGSVIIKIQNQPSQWRLTFHQKTKSYSNGHKTTKGQAEV